jgi:hypothetical protein
LPFSLSEVKGNNLPNIDPELAIIFAANKNSIKVLNMSINKELKLCVGRYYININ